ncbi:hypothetical protein OHS33_22120 [Streptomyces sp. NBC_00536]|uniref:hypothetical protein n=1 Tax=Streptomyces sp. NBC_00536 TaxID=2975769 RepID=UPI002E82384D|nr:hypothetical protein [Streptomyces sp. NBC_00536]WUC80790.1 hypothetical protein OHS33_22120 [Streptomyces sp. NBC_00536]
MPPASSGTPRWDSQAQRWVWDAAPAAPSSAPTAAPPTVPAQPTAPPEQPPYGPPPAHPVYGPPDPGIWLPGGADQQTPPQTQTQPAHAQPPFPPPGYPIPPAYPGADGYPGGDGYGPQRRWLTPATAGIAVAAVAIGAAVVWFVLRDSGGSAPDQARGTATPSATASLSPDPTGGPSASASASPSSSASPSASTSASTSPSAAAGHVTVTDPKGFTVAVPKGWYRDDPGNGIFYRTADRSSLLQIFQVVEPELSPLDAVKGASADLRNRTSGYTEIKVGAVPGGSGACELVYEYDSAESHGRRRGVERVFYAQDGNKWALLTAGPAGEWDATQEHLAAAVASFHP